MPYGYYVVSVRIENVAALQEAMRRADQNRLTGWPPWWWPTRDGIQPYVRQNTIECHIGDGDDDAAHPDFWRVSDHGELLVVRGYVEWTLWRTYGSEPINRARCLI